MALSRDTNRKARGAGQQMEVAIATGATLYVGSLAVRRNTTSRALAGTAATGRRILGVVEQLNSTVNGPGAGTGVGNTSGTEIAVIRYLDERRITVATAIRTNTSLGLNVFVADDDKVAGTAVGTAGTRVKVGQLVEWAETDKSAGWVAINRFGPTDIAV